MVKTEFVLVAEGRPTQGTGAPWGSAPQDGCPDQIQGRRKEDRNVLRHPDSGWNDTTVTTDHNNVLMWGFPVPHVVLNA